MTANELPGAHTHRGTSEGGYGQGPAQGSAERTTARIPGIKECSRAGRKEEGDDKERERDGQVTIIVKKIGREGERERGWSQPSFTFHNGRLLNASLKRERENKRGGRCD